MKTALHILTLCAAVLLAGCEKDNFDGPDAQVHGKIIDALTGQPVPQDIVDGSLITAYEQGFENPVAQYWAIMNSGEWRNTMVFANKYNFELTNCNFFPVYRDGVEIRKGDNQLDFTVKPYIRITECQITYEEATNTVRATFKAVGGDAGVNVAKFTLYAFTDMYVSSTIHLTNVSGSEMERSYPAGGVPITTDNTETYELDISAGLKPGRLYYFRVGAQAAVAGVGTVKPNYSQTVKIMMPQ